MQSSYQLDRRDFESFSNNQKFVELQFRRHILSDTPALNFANIELLGLVLTHGNLGEFILLVERISQLPYI
jgi:hypothetical protein